MCLCGGKGWGIVVCGFCGAEPPYPRKPMTVVISERYPPRDFAVPEKDGGVDSLTPAGKRNRDSKKGNTRQEIREEAKRRRELALSARLTKRGSSPPLPCL